MQFEDGAVSSVSDSETKVEAMRDDFRVAVQETVEATGLGTEHFEWNGSKPYSEVSFEPGQYRATGCGGNAKDGFEYHYAAVVKGDRKYTATEWEVQSEKVRARWESLGWEVKNVAPGTRDAPGITIGASTPAGVTVLYTVSEGGVDYVNVDSPCSAEIPAPSSSASTS
ncbi:hypothetical protein [Rothia nasimurium]|uniref:hypothetical protein n=1 Tax=Rothia nasimurium TaxID=85336 RepID=UPI001F47227C|nr:hypothetical protein [Rothia nasimurium]